MHSDVYHIKGLIKNGLQIIIPYTFMFPKLNFECHHKYCAKDKGGIQ